jgi:DNA adenine methylase
MNPEITRPTMRYHGGKFRLAPWIISHFPQHRIYTEAFGGAGSVLMCKPRSHGEVYNDLDGEIVNVMRVLRDRRTRELLTELLALTPYARAEFKGAFEPCTDPVERARRTLVRAEMGFGSAGATKGYTGFRLDTKRNGCNAQHVWAALPDKLATFGSRLQGVLIENRNANLVLRDHDTPGTLHFVDPPYPHGTRSMAGACYRHEMTDEQHLELIRTLRNLEGMVILSSSIYESELGDWQQVRKPSQIAAQNGSTRRTEVLWFNPACAQALQHGLFDLEMQAA